MGQRKPVLDGGQDLAMGRGSFKGERSAYCKVPGRCAMSCAKMAELIGMLFGCGLALAQGSMCYMRVHTGATWQIQLNRPCSAVLQKRLNRSRCHLWCVLGWAQGTRAPHVKGNF